MARNLIGMEMTCFGMSEQFTIEYAGGGYINPKREPVPDVVDMNCYACTASYYTREADFLPFCPNCGHFDRKGFMERPALVDFIRGCDLSWLKQLGLIAVTVQTWDKGDWQLKFCKDAMQLEAGGQYKAVRGL